MTMSIRFTVRVDVDDDKDDGLKVLARQGTAHHSGRRVHADWYRQGGRPRFRLREFEVVEEPAPGSAADESILPYLLRLRDACLERYEDEGRCTPAEVKTMRELWVNNLTLHELARQEGVTPQAISSRINGLANKAPEFYRWWRRKNLCHQGRHRRT